MNWIFLITASVLSGSVAALLQRVLVRGKTADTHAYSTLTQLLSAGVSLIAAIILGRTSFPNLRSIIDNQVYLFVLLSAILYTLNAIFCFRALKFIEVSKFSVLYTTRAVVTIIVASIFLGESLTSVQLLGSGLIIASILLLNTKSTKDLLKFGKGEVYALIAALAFGVATVSDKYIIEWFDFVPYLMLDFLLPALLLIMIKPRVVAEFKGLFSKKIFVPILIFSSLYTLAAITFFGAMSSSDNTSLVSSVGQVSTISTVVLGIIFLKERKELAKKVIAGVVSVFGLILLII